MRNVFAQTLTELADADERIVLLSGDIGNRLFDDYKDRCPGRFLNCGVAEANMMSVAAGMAMSGLKPVVYTIVPFVTTRCLEQIRVDVCYHNVPVVIAGVGGGLSYASLGPTHHSCEDIALLRVLPQMTVVCPGDRQEVKAALRSALECSGPVYLRLGKKGEPDVHSHSPEFKIGKAITIQEGRDAALLSTGNMLPVAVQAAQILHEQGLSAEVVSMHTVKPLDESRLGDLFNRVPLVAALEEHSIHGGLGGAVAEWLSEQDLARPARLVRVGTPDEFFHEAGDQQFARRRLGLDAESIAAKVIAAHQRTASHGVSP